MKKGIILLILVFCMLVFPIFGVFGLVVIDNGVYGYSVDRSLVVDSYGRLHALYQKSNDSVWYQYSDDDGETWTGSTMLNVSVVAYGDKYTLVIDSNDKLFAFYVYAVGVGAKAQQVYYKTSTDRGLTWSSETAVITQTGATVGTIPGLSATVDNDDDVTVVVSYDYASWNTKVYARRYTDDTGTWSSVATLQSSGTGLLSECGVVALSNDSCFVTYEYEPSAPTWYSLYYVWWTYDFQVSSASYIYNSASLNHQVYTHSTAVDLNDNINIIYAREDGSSTDYGLYYKKYTTSTNTLGTEELIFYDSSYPVLSCSVSCSTNGYVYAFYSGDVPTASTDKISYYYRGSSVWNYGGVINIGNDNEVENPISLYQRYPSNNILSPTGYAFMFFNDTNNTVNFESTSLNWYTGGEGGEGEGGDTECTTLNQYQTMGNGFDCPTSTEVICTHEIYPVRVIEFGNPSGTYTTTIKGLSVYLDSNPADYLENYVAYINGESIGTADCSYQYGEGYVIQWLCNVELDGEGYVVELYNQLNTTGMTGPFAFWNVRGVDWEGFVGPVQELAYTYAHDYPNSLIDGYLNGGQTKFTTFFKLHHTGFIEPPVTTYNNSIILTDNFEPYHPDYGIPFIDISNEIKTGFFIVSVNNTQEPFYKLKIFYEGSEIYTQNYPMNIIKARSTYGFTPLNEGNYSVNITTSTGTNIIGKPFYCEGNAGDLDLILYTVPNPSERGSDYLAYYDINLNGTYSIGLFSGQTNDLSYTNALQFTELHNDAGSIVIQGRDGEDFYKLSLFKQYGTDWQIIGPLHIHRVNRIVGENWINVQYWSGVTHITDTNRLRIQGAHTLNSKGVYILDNGNIIRENVEQGFNFLYVLSNSELDKPHNFSLRLLINDEWETLAFDIFTPQSVGGGGVGFDWVNLIPGDFKVIIGVAIITIITIFPLIVAMQMNKHHISVNIPGLVYVAFFFLGLVTTTILGFFDAWVIFIILLGLIVAFGLAWLVGQKSNQVSEEE
ncbi:MAG: hypothetical protein BV457_01580 [Thermoplasmata archaeon M9B1D]|nr:MAG: hypothetical protein BV457_01580 [Thermoplasmata archaeon M9B1D]